MKDIAILLPYKENFTESNAGAASIWVKDYLNSFGTRGKNRRDDDITWNLFLIQTASNAGLLSR